MRRDMRRLNMRKAPGICGIAPEILTAGLNITCLLTNYYSSPTLATHTPTPSHATSLVMHIVSVCYINPCTHRAFMIVNQAGLVTV